MKYLRKLTSFIAALLGFGNVGGIPAEAADAHAPAHGSGRVLVTSQNAAELGLNWAKLIQVIASSGSRPATPNAAHLLSDAPLTLEVDFYDEAETSCIDIRGLDGRVLTVDLEIVRDVVVNFGGGGGGG